MAKAERIAVAILCRLSFRQSWDEPHWVYLVSQRNDIDKPLPGLLQAPTGKWLGPLFESLLDAAKREVFEEADVTVPACLPWIRHPLAPLKETDYAPGKLFYPFFCDVTGHLSDIHPRVAEQTNHGLPKTTPWVWYSQRDIYRLHFPCEFGVANFMLSLDTFTNRLFRPRSLLQ